MTRNRQSFRISASGAELLCAIYALGRAERRPNEIALCAQLGWELDELQDVLGPLREQGLVQDAAPRLTMAGLMAAAQLSSKMERSVRAPQLRVVA